MSKMTREYSASVDVVADSGFIGDIVDGGLRVGVHVTTHSTQHTSRS